MLLLTLGEVSELVSHSHDLSETLSNIVTHIQQRFHTEVCSVYSVEKDTGDLVLSATVGLRSESINQVRMRIHEGLTGLVAERKAPVSVEDAPKHPRFRFFPESGEEQYRSFLGVPLIQGGEVQGVLVIQHRDPRRYSANEVRMLVAIAAQLAILVANSRLTRELSQVIRQSESSPLTAQQPPRLTQLQATSAGPGFAYGRALRFEEFDFTNPALVARLPGTVDEEIARLHGALEQGRRDIDRAAKHLAELLGDQFGALMQAQRLMLEDSAVQRSLLRLIESGSSVEQAVVMVCGEYLRAFAKLDNPFFYERIYDIKDVFRRVLAHAAPDTNGFDPNEPLIVVAHEVSLLELFGSDLHRVRGIVVEKGGAHSHVAILARSLGIPMLTQTHRLLESVRVGDELFVDAAAGVVYINPDNARRSICLKLLESHSKPPVAFVESIATPIRLETTVNLLPEVARTVQLGGEAVGLYRSEFLELAQRSFPSEEEQYDVYRKMLRLLDGRPLTLRTLDLRAEKLFGIVSTFEKPERSWEWRLVDQLPHVQDLLRTQLRAALRAACEGPMRILFPMVTTQRQLNCAYKLLREAKQSLVEEGLNFCENVPIGVMIEAPSSALLAGVWAKQADFICVGSNDLLHSLLGIERSDDQLMLLKTPLDPGYLQAVRYIVKRAHAARRPVTVCGEAASNPRAMLALYALGVDALSIPPEDLPRARQLFAEVSLPTELAEVRKKIARASDAEEVELVLAQSFPIKSEHELSHG